VAYEQHYSLAQFFSEDEDDKWLADHFFFNCMNVAIKVKDDGGRLRAEASINAAKVFESLGKCRSTLEDSKPDTRTRAVMSRCWLDLNKPNQFVNQTFSTYFNAAVHAAPRSRPW